eukprot:TRINITY_DN6202_c0_g1_i1.p1 TRINITY_DN6202_c0_g1~~TRINITY_DN6202_c0_g1_i1.p1  ORF type:complete len:252 (+),score=45.70 TRINITY_DN6202_c0_g1_i1:22-756(+)
MERDRRSREKGNSTTDNLECPVCFEVFVAATTTSCGHSYCAPCILRVWEKQQKRGKISCPLDRRPVSMLIPAYALRGEVDARKHAGEIGQDEDDDRETLSVQEYDEQIEAYNEVFQNAPRNLLDQAHEDWVLAQRIFTGNAAAGTPGAGIGHGGGGGGAAPLHAATAHQAPGTSMYKVVILASFLVAFLYLIFPMDLIPDSLGLVGLVDDVFVVLAVLWVVITVIEMYRRNLHTSIANHAHHLG